MACPRWLLVNDVLHEIIRHVYGRLHHEYQPLNETPRHEIWYKDARKSLASLARTCRALQKPALDALWAELPSLAPLIRCLPQDLWSDNSPNGTLVGDVIQ